MDKMDDSARQALLRNIQVGFSLYT